MPQSAFNILTMKIYLLIYFLTSIQLVLAQDTNRQSYLLVRIGASYDLLNKRDAFFIIAESGCDSAKYIYSLKNYDFKKNAVNTDGIFYYDKKDTATNLYNYFLSATDALNFLSYCGWTLFNSYTEIFSGYTNERDGLGTIQPITTVSSRPVFCFKK